MGGRSDIPYRDVKRKLARQGVSIEFGGKHPKAKRLLPSTKRYRSISFKLVRGRYVPAVYVDQFLEKLELDRKLWDRS